MMNGFNERFDEMFDEESHVGPYVGEPIKTYNVDGASTTNELPLHNFITLEMGKEHVIEEEYIIDAIYIGKDDDNFEDKPNVIRFNER